MTNDRLVQLTSKASVAAAFMLIIAKLYAVYTTHSLGILSSLFDSSVDMIASIGNLIAVTIAARPADHKYQFGYGKLEAVAALIQSILIGASLLFLVSEALQRFFSNDITVTHSTTGIWVMALSIVMTLGLTAFQRYTIQRTQSLAIKADMLHYKTDTAVNIVVLISLFLNTYYNNIDTIACIGICGYVMWATRHIVVESLEVLLDKEINVKDQSNIKAILNNHPSVKGFHNFRTRSSGKRIFIEAHIEMDPKLTLVEAHNIAHDLKDAVEAVYPHSEMIVHQDPVGYDESSERRF
ncbi:cation diffusion facilitator family transporter [Candidatus Bodocaedibacter vickermanii]|uniref:Ferrous-iron efflux pump FieF n=1 Tax=Candidatus Bodocaedibacter vickermanii TaxID=2741701 RepID=A0A7L9RVR3_9PROT|nr:Ferrous-iron efflux pump FieF [Candidatus Paracaedibacteraceae bacterium 'Lake Konstanz']